MLWTSARLWVWLTGRRLPSSAAVTHRWGGAALRAATATSAHSLLGNFQHFKYTWRLCTGYFSTVACVINKTICLYMLLFGVFCHPASLLHLLVAAAGVSSPGGYPLPGLLPLLDPGLHHPHLQDECTDHGCHSSPATRGCLCLRLLTKEGKKRIHHSTSSPYPFSHMLVLSLYFNLSGEAMRPERCCAATEL